MRKRLYLLILVVVMLVAGCGQKQTVTAGQAFGSSETTTLATAAPVLRPEEPAAAKPAASAAPEIAVPTAMPKPTPEAAEAASMKDAQPAAIPSPKASEPPKAVPSPAPAAQPATVKAEAAPTPSAQPKSKADEPSKSAKPPTSLTNEINWDQFFDNDKQDTPSDRFWDMSGKTVQIKGFMGEVLSFDKHWFLLIPKPGAECPFDNGDETYWNKIMIVFLPDDVKLRYTSGPLLIKGKLDVGVKLDESGYKTMFRLYDASFEKIKE
ncbi:hypothetical protein [Paenibacillus planticolens]|uniref:Lipoprotein n=1 Tax=Paenibacillus planticolens TaxID=2654976 RepID=A0ABX1ZUD6_9BACL|nr:hypothetical protein [Paenibacillus planticolens]NOV03516.1 hypothetical protein [Paenibacillus planticolens]